MLAHRISWFWWLCQILDIWVFVCFWIWRLKGYFVSVLLSLSADEIVQTGQWVIKINWNYCQSSLNYLFILLWECMPGSDFHFILVNCVYLTEGVQDAWTGRIACLQHHIRASQGIANGKRSLDRQQFELIITHLLVVDNWRQLRWESEKPPGIYLVTVTVLSASFFLIINIYLITNLYYLHFNYSFSYTSSTVYLISVFHKTCIQALDDDDDDEWLYMRGV